MRDSYDDPLIAELYDLDCEQHSDDIPFYESLARDAGGAALELGVGTGRVAVALARAGIAVSGIDSSEAMLGRARCRASDEGVAVELQRARMERFELGRSFGLIYAAFGTFHHLLTEEAQRSCLASVALHLAPGGTFACDLRPLLFEDWEEGDSVPLFHDWTRMLPGTGELVTKLRAVRNDAASQTKREAQFFDIVASDGTLRRKTVELELRYLGEGEIRSLVEAAGLAVEGIYGGFSRAAYDEEGDYLIAIARKLEEVT
jgi:SAM-dependent methyltransferase